MKKILKSKLFVVLTPIIVFVIGVAAGVLLGFQPSVAGGVGGGNGYISTKYNFNIETAIGYWLLALVLAAITLLICLVVRKQYISEEKSA